MYCLVFFWLILVSEASEPTSVPEPQPVNTKSSECPENFVHFGDSCYYFAMDVCLRLYNAENTCKALRSSLCGIESLSEFNFITKELDKRIEENPNGPFTTFPIWRQQFWTSGQRASGMYGWTWGGESEQTTPVKTVKPLTFQDWYPGEPSEVYEQGVTALYKRGHWGWNDFVTLDDLSFICEKEKTGNEDCPENFKEFNQSCYRFVADNDRSQARAKLYCNGLETHLVAIETQEEWNFIKATIEEIVDENDKELTYEQWWTGGVQASYTSPISRHEKAEMVFNWDVTISQVPSAVWHPFHPLANPTTLYLTLYYMESKWYWVDEPRDSSLHYICEYPRKGEAGCKRGWIQNNTSCYLIPKYTTRDRHSAEVACMKAGARLVAINSKDELEYLTSTLTARNIPNGAKWWTGGLPIEGTWIWSQNYAMFGEGTLKAAWSPGEPNNWDDQENRTTLSLREAKWGLNDVPEAPHIVLPFICEAKLNSGKEDSCRRIVGRKQITRLPRTGGTWANLILNATFTCPGRVTKWRYYRSNTEFSVYAGVWRPDRDGYFMLVGQVEFPAAANGEREVEASPITVLPGDVLGIHYPRTAEAGVIAHAIAEDRTVDQNELSRIMVLELHKEDLTIGRSIDPNVHTISDYEQCLSIQAIVNRAN